MTVDDKIKFIENYKQAANAAEGSKFDANANVTEKNIATLSAELPKKDNIDLQRAIIEQYLEKMYGKEMAQSYKDDLKHHIIYTHDETNCGLPYCCSITLYPFLLNGLKALGGTSEPPKHTESFVGGFINLVFLVAGQFAGAVATIEFLTYMDHFLRIDYGQNYTSKLDEIVEQRVSGQLTLRKKIENWFAQVVYTINQPAGARGYQSVFWNIGYFDKYYFESIFKDFVFPDGDEPSYSSLNILQKIFMKWFNKERTKCVISFPVETFNLLTDPVTGKYMDEEAASFVSEMWSEGASFFCYQSDSADALSSCCRLKSGLEDNTFSFSLGSSGLLTGSKKVCTLNLNRIVQDWYKEKDKITLKKYIEEITGRVHKYLNAFNEKLHDDYKAGLLTIYSAGFIDLDRQFLTVGINGFVEAAEFLGIKISPESQEYKKLADTIIGAIEGLNKKERTEHCKYNLEFVPAENLAVKNYNWDKRDGYIVPETRNLYNSYFYIVEDDIDPIKKFFYQGHGFADKLSGGVACHINLDCHLSKKQYRMLLDVASIAGCNYFTYNIPNTICNECGYISKNHLDHCEKCGSKNVDLITRIIGYLRKVSNFSEARQEEAKRRFYSKMYE